MKHEIRRSGRRSMLPVVLAGCAMLLAAWLVRAADEQAPPSTGEKKQEEPAPAQEAPKPIKSLVKGRMVCCEECKAKLDLANGIKKCAGCKGMCNVAHKYCPACAKKLGVCEVCGRQMQPPKSDELQKKREQLKKDVQFKSLPQPEKSE